MSTKSDYFFLNIKQVYPTFPKPSVLETEIWEELLEPYCEEVILKGIKSYRKTVDSPYAPSPAKFSEYLYQPNPALRRSKSLYDDLPPCPESYLMAEDMKAGRCVHNYPTYVKAVNYLLDTKTREHMPEEIYKKSTRFERYRFAVDNGFFAHFDETLDLVYTGGHKHGKI